MDDFSTDSSIDMITSWTGFKQNGIVLKTPLKRSSHPGGFPIYKELLEWSAENLDGLFFMVDQEDYFSPNFIESISDPTLLADVIVPEFYEESLENRGRRKIKLYDELLQLPSHNWLIALMTYPEFWGTSYLWHSALGHAVVKDTVLPFFKIFLDEHEATGYRHIASDNVLSYILLGKKDIVIKNQRNAIYFKGLKEAMSIERVMASENRAVSLLVGNASIDETMKSLGYLEKYGYQTAAQIKTLAQLLQKRLDLSYAFHEAWNRTAEVTRQI
jgi:hypothetical protein